MPLLSLKVKGHKKKVAAKKLFNHQFYIFKTKHYRHPGGFFQLKNSNPAHLLPSK